MHWAGMQSSGLCVHVKRQSDVSRCGSISASEQGELKPGLSVLGSLGLEA